MSTMSALNFKLNTEDLNQLKVAELKEILKYHDENISGNKPALIARCISLRIRLNAADTDASDASDFRPNATAVVDPFKALDVEKEISYEQLQLSAKDRIWSGDLRKMVEFNFHQLHNYLVVKTFKYDDLLMKGSCYKKLKSYQFFMEGHVSNVEVASGHGYVWTRAKVLASMKRTKYRVMLVFHSTGDVKFAACDCPAGLGIHGQGKCNHIGGVLFAVNSFYTSGLHSNPSKVSCTSKLNGWIVPRNLSVPPKPVKNINVEKIQFGIDSSKKGYNQSSVFDPRAPQHRTANINDLDILYKNITECAPSSGYFLFHKKPSELHTSTSMHVSEEVDFVDSIESMDVVEDVSIETEQDLCNNGEDRLPNSHTSIMSNISVVKENYNISDDVAIDNDFLAKYVTNIVENETITQELINDIEICTKLQAENDLWKELHECKMTASNFGRIVKCSKNPNGLLKSMLYDNPCSKYLQYGKDHEQDAIDMYIKLISDKKEHVQVQKSGIFMSKERPGYGASLDGIVIGSDGTYGGLECKCPLSQRGKSAKEACKTKTFYLEEHESGNIKLKTNHNYYIQIQGQLFVTKMEFVDFVVWFGPDQDIFMERIVFDEEKWYRTYLPLLDFFYKWAFIPELLTRRVKRGLTLHPNWNDLKASH